MASRRQNTGLGLATLLVFAFLYAPVAVLDLDGRVLGIGKPRLRERLRFRQG